MTISDNKYDVAISFAGEDRKVADTLAKQLQHLGLTVFYDDFEKAKLWGVNLYEHFHQVYSLDSAFCIIISSKHYENKLWTKHELRQAQERAFTEKREYILPLTIDGTLPNTIPNTTGYLDIRKSSTIEIANFVLEKVCLLSGINDAHRKHALSHLQSIGRKIVRLEALSRIIFWILTFMIGFGIYSMSLFEKDDIMIEIVGTTTIVAMYSFLFHIILYRAYQHYAERYFANRVGTEGNVDYIFNFIVQKYGITSGHALSSLQLTGKIKARLVDGKI